MKSCWNCGQPVGGPLFCESCGSLQPPPTGYYELLGLSPALSLSAEDLQKRFYDLSRQLHPDRFARKPERERQYSLDASSVLNDAYRTLRDPVKRAGYFLAREGFDLPEQRSQDVPPELLEEMFELNEALEELRAGDASARPQLERAGQRFSGMLASIDAGLEALFAAYDAQPGRETLGQIRGALNRRKYIQNLVQHVDISN